MVAAKDSCHQTPKRVVTEQTYICVLNSLNRRCHKYSDLFVNKTVLCLAPNDMLSGCAGTETWDECLASTYSSE